MSPNELAYQLWQEQALPSLSLDELLANLAIEHSEYRQWLKKKGYELYKPTPGLINEIHFEGLELHEAESKYHLTRAESTAIFYRSPNSRLTVDKNLAKELLAQNLANEDIAHILNCSVSRISQLKSEFGLVTQKKAKYKRLRQPEKIALKEYAKTHSKEQTAKEFKVSIATVYRITGA